MPRPKIQGCVARGGVPDPDAPNCRESTRYWAYVEGEEEQVDSTSATTTVSAVLRPQDALQAFGVNNSPMATVHVPGPAALARQAIGMPVETPAAPAVPAPPVPRDLDQSTFGVTILRIPLPMHFSVMVRRQSKGKGKDQAWHASQSPQWGSACR